MATSDLLAETLHAGDRPDLTLRNLAPIQRLKAEVKMFPRTIRPRIALLEERVDDIEKQMAALIDQACSRTKG